MQSVSESGKNIGMDGIEIPNLTKLDFEKLQKKHPVRPIELDIDKLNKERQADNESLQKIFDKHRLWLESKFMEGERADFQNANINKIDLKGINLHFANLQGADLRKNYLSGANLFGANLQETRLQEVNLNGADLRHADLMGTYLQKANLRGANLRGANLKEADLREADLREADLYGADLQGADLREANLQGVDLYGAYFLGAKLQEADLREVDHPKYILGANLLGAKVTSAFFEILPDIARIKVEKDVFIIDNQNDRDFINRSIEFPPEYKQAGISILNYFSEVLKTKYPDTNATVQIKQDGLKVIMTIDPGDGNKEIIEKALDEYGLVVRGQK
ncbi:MAG: pentapeptide repeat-containing protein, partial [Desulfobacteraceae bacterium]|nr:pentapeptide repeat-containing protein [Desulfobacteraceae bacterium]